VLVAPAVGEPLAEPGARNLPAELGPEAAAGVASAGRHRAFDVAQLGLHACLQRACDRGSGLHAEAWQVLVRAIGATATRLS
jgi:hypothetical protein